MNKAKYYLGICAVLNMTIELCLTFFFFFLWLLGNMVVFFQGRFKHAQTEYKMLSFLYVVKSIVCCCNRDYLHIAFSSSGCSEEKVSYCDRNCLDILQRRPAWWVLSLIPRHHTASKWDEQVNLWRGSWTMHFQQDNLGACFASVSFLS